MKELIMEKYYNDLTTRKTCAARGNAYKRMVDLFERYEELHAIWEHRPYAKTYSDRFVKKESHYETNIVPEMVRPNTKGLYLLGQTNFNPYTREEFYWVKVGQSTDLNNRLSEYYSYNPMVWINGINEIEAGGLRELEKSCHTTLRIICQEQAFKSQEWFRVSREDYLEICEQGFKFFKI